MELRDEIRQYRRIHECSQAKFAELCGLSQSAISRAEKGDRGMSCATANKVRDVLGPDPEVRSIQWVSTRERLPEISGRYLVRIACIHEGRADRVTEILHFSLKPDSWAIDGPNVVTYWAELPGLPQDEWL